MRAKVGPALETVTVNGTAYEVLRITHEGTWQNHCPGGGNLEGDIKREDLYSPNLGIFVMSTFRLFDEDGSNTGNIRWELASYTIPKK